MDFKLDSTTGDLDITYNKLSLTSTIEDMVRQRLNIKLFTNKGEWKFNIDFGIPWMQAGDARQILYKTNPAFVEGVIKEAILGDPLITSIESYTPSWDKKLAIYSANIKAITSTGEIIGISV